MTLWFARTDPRTPWYAKVMGGFVVAYALSPIDLIPDFIPVLGYLDDLILLPIFIWLTLKMLPQDVIEASRQRVEKWLAERRPRPRNVAGAVVIVAIWVLVATALSFWVARAVG